MGLELELLSGSGNWSLPSAVGQSGLWRIGIAAIPDDQIACPPVLVGFGLLQGLVTSLLIRQVTETLTGFGLLQGLVTTLLIRQVTETLTVAGHKHPCLTFYE